MNLHATVADVAVTSPEVHEPHTTVGELEQFFADDHVHLALIVDGHRLVAAVERCDLDAVADPDLQARFLGRRRGRVIASDAPAVEALGAMRASGRRRLAVIDGNGLLVGLLCLKARGNGFCSDADVASRKRSRGVAAARSLVQTSA